MPRSRPPEPTLSAVLMDQFAFRDQSSTDLYRTVAKLLSLIQSQGQRITKLEASQRQLGKRLRDVEPRPEPRADAPESEQRSRRIDFVFKD